MNSQFKSVELKAFGRPHLVTVPDDDSVQEIALPGEKAPLRRSLFVLRKALAKYRAWYVAQLAGQRRMVEEDARRLNGFVTWKD